MACSKVCTCMSVHGHETDMPTALRDVRCHEVRIDSIRPCRWARLGWGPTCAVRGTSRVGPPSIDAPGGRARLGRLVPIEIWPDIGAPSGTFGKSPHGVGLGQNANHCRSRLLISRPATRLSNGSKETTPTRARAEAVVGLCLGWGQTDTSQ